MKSNIVRLVRERFINRGSKSSQPVKLGASTALIINPTMLQSRNRLDDKNPDEKENSPTKAQASLTNPMWR